MADKSVRLKPNQIKLILALLTNFPEAVEEALGEEDSDDLRDRLEKADG